MSATSLWLRNDPTERESLESDIIPIRHDPPHSIASVASVASVIIYWLILRSLLQPLVTDNVSIVRCFHPEDGGDVFLRNFGT
jgi:hypothetical protein